MTSLKRAAIRGYFFERCAGGAQSRDFWPTIKPFLSKGSKNSQEICLLENGNVISDPDSVCNIFNDHFSKIANDIGRNLNDEEVKNHESVQKIRENIPRSEPLVFKQVSEKQVNRYIRSIGNAKATGLDNHSAKILKIIQPCYVTHLTRLVNRMFAESTFPESMKNARVTPIFKKEDPLLKKYYRPVSVLPIRSKIFERAMVDQLNDHFQTLFHPFLSAYRKGYSCQSTLLALTEDWKKALDDGHYVGAILMDLSKAFDCLPHKLLLEKLRAYNIEDAISEIKCETIQQGQKIMSLVNDSKQHDQLINQVMQKTHTCDMNGYPLLADVVARATPPVQGAAIKQLARPHGQTDGVATRYAPMNRRITENKVRTEAVEHTHTQVGVVPDSSEGFVIPQAHRRKNEKVAQRRNNQRRGVIIGRGESTGLTAVPPPQRDFFISRVHKLDGMKEVGDFMTNKGVHIRDISKRSNDNAKMNSFKISISVDDMQKVKDPLFWPKGWIVRRWFERVESIQNDGRVAQSERVHRNSI